MKAIPFSIALAVAALALGVVVSSPLVRNAQETTSMAEARAQGELTLDQLEHFPGLPVYWLGEEYKGLKLVKAGTQPSGIRVCPLP